MSKILVTGARGFIGRHILQPLIDSGFEVHALSSNEGRVAAEGTSEIHWHTANLLSHDVAYDLVEKIQPSHIIHAAWVTEHGTFWGSRDNLKWLAATTELIRGFSDFGGKRFVNFGSCAEYSWDHGVCVEGQTPEIPNTLYGTSKLAVHKLLTASAEQFGFSAVTGRVFFCYGPNEGVKRLVPQACRELLAKNKAKFSSGAQIRDFMHVTDIARGFVSLAMSDIIGACNVSSAEPLSIKDVVQTIARLANAEEHVELGALPGRAKDPPMIVGANQLLKSTGWTQTISLEAGLQSTLDWWKKHDA